MAWYTCLLAEPLRTRQQRRLRRLRVEPLEDRRLLANVAPIATDDEYTVTQGTLVVTSDSDGAMTPTLVSDNGVLANDLDSDGDELRAVKLSEPEHGTLNLKADGTFAYRLDASGEREDSFTYAVEDVFGNSDTATVTLRFTTPWSAPREVRLDVNNDGFITPIDALIVINELNINGSYQLPNPPVPPNVPPPYFDVNADGFVSAIDALMVINHLIKQQSFAEGESTALTIKTINDDVESSARTIELIPLDSPTQSIPIAVQSKEQIGETKDVTPVLSPNLPLAQTVDHRDDSRDLIPLVSRSLDDEQVWRELFDFIFRQTILWTI